MFNIGIDLGGTNTKVGLVDENGKVVKKLFVKTEEPIIEKIINLIDEISVGQNIGYIGMGCPGLVDDEKGKVIYAENICWKNVDVRKYIPNVHLINDANAATLAEYKFGALKNTENALLLTLGTGIGGGAVLNGKLYTGTNGFALEPGHIEIEKGLELEKLAKPPFNEKYIEYLATGITNLCNIFYPEKIVLTGGIAENREKLILPLSEMVNDRIYGNKYSAYKVLITNGKLGYDAGIIGSSIDFSIEALMK